MQDTLNVVIPVAIAHAVVLAVLIVIVRQLLVGDTRKAIARIHEVEAEVRKREEAIRREIDEHEREFARRKTETEQEMRKHQEESENEIATLKEQMVGDAKKESNRIIEQARKNEATFRAQIVQEMEEKAVDYGSEIFKLVFSDRMGRELHRQFMSELLDALSEVEGATITVEGNEAEFVSSHPLDDDQKQRFHDLLKDKFDVDVEINEKVDESLLAGMVFKLGSLEIDGSLRNRYQEATEEVKKVAHQVTAEV
jgi:F0F1-type ATP synthase membrane subunit b/b'